MPRAHRVLLFLVALVLTACGAPALPTGPAGMATPSGGGGGKYQCRNVSGKTDPWLVEWDGPQKARMQVAARDGVLLVRYEGCELEVLYGCEQVGAYDIVPTTLSMNTEYITNEDEVFAKLPIGALKLVGEFRQGDRWSLDYAILGMQKTRLESVDTDFLEGECARATHFVSAMAVGAYRLVSEAKRKAAAGIEVLGAGAGASTGGAAGALRQAGAYDRCVADATSSDSACQAVVQLFLEPLAGRTTTSADGAQRRSLLPSVSIEDAILELGQPAPEVFYVSGRMRPSVAEIVAVQLPPALAGSWKRLLRAEEAVAAANRARAKERDKLEALCRRPNDRCAGRAVYDRKSKAIDRRYEKRIARKEREIDAVSKKAITSFDAAAGRKENAQIADALHFALGELHYSRETVEYFDALEEHERRIAADPASVEPPPVSSHATSVEHYLAVANVESGCADDLVWWARYALAYALSDQGDHDGAAEQYRVLGECEWRAETAEVLFNWGEYLFEKGEGAAALDAAISAYKVAAEVAASFKKPVIVSKASYRAMWAAYLNRHDALTLELAKKVIETAGPGGEDALAEEAELVAAYCVDRMGGLKRGALEELDTASFAAVADIVAEVAAARDALVEAQRAWDLLLERAPGSIRAPLAVAGLIAIAKRRGDTARAEELAVRKMKSYSATAAWAEALRAARDPDGHPTDREIIDAANADELVLEPPPADEKSASRLFFSRTRDLFEMCGFVEGGDAEANVRIAVSSYDNGDAAVEVEVECAEASAEKGCAERDSRAKALACIKKNGPRYYRGLGRSVTAAFQVTTAA